MVVDTPLTPQEIDRVFHALADATRRDILTRAFDEELSVSALARGYAISLPAVQKHVAVLEQAGLVSRRRAGRETRVHAVPDRLRRARDLLDRYEALWRQRIAAMDDLLAAGDMGADPVASGSAESSARRAARRATDPANSAESSARRAAAGATEPPNSNPDHPADREDR